MRKSSNSPENWQEIFVWSVAEVRNIGWTVPCSKWTSIFPRMREIADVQVAERTDVRKSVSWLWDLTRSVLNRTRTCV